MSNLFIFIVTGGLSSINTGRVQRARQSQLSNQPYILQITTSGLKAGFVDFKTPLAYIASPYEEACLFKVPPILPTKRTIFMLKGKVAKLVNRNKKEMVGSKTQYRCRHVVNPSLIPGTREAPKHAGYRLRPLLPPKIEKNVIH